MSAEQAQALDPRVERALSELQRMIQQKYPAATFAVSHGEDPEGIYLTPTVDVEDPERVFDLVVDRLLELQVDDGLAVYVVPVRPVDRVLESLKARQ